MAIPRATGSLITAALAAIGASVCCVGPLLLLALGISGAWIAGLTVFEPWRPYFIAATVLFLGLAFARLYRKRSETAAGGYCPLPLSVRRQRRAFWLVTITALALIAVPWVAPLFY